VTIKPLQTVLQSFGVEKIHFLKIDVKGFELQVLKGASSFFHGEDAPIICVELIKDFDRGKQGTSEEIINFLKNINSTNLIIPHTLFYF